MCLEIGRVVVLGRYIYFFRRTSAYNQHAKAAKLIFFFICSEAS